MNPSGFSERVFESTAELAQFGLNWFVQSTLLIGIGLIVGRLLRSSGAAVQSSVYRATLVAVLLCPFCTMLLSSLGINGFVVPLPFFTAIQGPAITSEVASNAGGSRSVGTATLGLQPSANNLQPTGGPGDFQAPDIDVPLEGPADAPTAVMSAASSGTAVSSASASTSQNPLPQSASSGGAWIFAAVFLWMCSAFLLLAKLANAHRKIRRIVRSAAPVDERCRETVRQAAALVGAPAPRVLQTPLVHSACLVGVIQPVILLTESLEGDSTRDVLIHELAHLVRRDGLWNLLRHFTTSVLCFQPLAWLLSRRIECTAEDVCDDYVIQFGGQVSIAEDQPERRETGNCDDQRRRYAKCLVSVAQQSLPSMGAAGVSMISGRSNLAMRISRILNSNRLLSTRVNRRILGMVLTFACLMTVIAALVATRPAAAEHVEGAHSDNNSESSGSSNVASKKEKDTTGGTHIVAGRVVDSSGKPIPNAEVFLVRSTISDETPETDKQILQKVTTDKDGHFRVDVPTSFRRRVEGAYIVYDKLAIFASAKGYGIDWFSVNSDVGEPLLRLVRDTIPIEGRVLDATGKPVPNVKVRVQSIQTARSDLTEWAAKARNNSSIVEAPRYYYDAASDRKTASFPRGKYATVDADSIVPDAMTDAQGNFRIAGIGPNRRVELELEGSSIAKTLLVAVTRSMDAVNYPTNDPTRRSPVWFGAKFEYLAEPTQIVTGVVRDVDTREPLVNAVVSVQQYAGGLYVVNGFVSARTDENGRYRLVGLPKAPAGPGAYQLMVSTASEDPYFRTFVKAPRAIGLEPVECDIELKRAVWVKGRIVDRSNGKPVQALVSYYPLLKNAAARDYNNFGAGVSSLGNGDAYATADDGSFRIPAVPGRGVLVALAVDPENYRSGVGAEELGWPNNGTNTVFYHLMMPERTNSVREIDLPVNSDSVGFDVELVPVEREQFSLVDPDGKPLKNVQVAGMYGDSQLKPRAEIGDLPPEASDSVGIADLQLDQKRLVLFLHSERKLGSATIVEHNKLGTIKLQPCATITGRLLDSSGKPKSNVRVVAWIPEKSELPGPAKETFWRDRARRLQFVQTDVDGRFTFDRIIPGMSCVIRVEGHSQLHDSSVKPGEKIELGDWQLPPAAPNKDRRRDF